MQLSTFRLFEAVGSNEIVVIEHTASEAPRPLKCIQHAIKALGHRVSASDIETGANVACCLLKLTEEVVCENGWGAREPDVRAGLLELRARAIIAAKSASGRASVAIQSLIEGIDATLRTLRDGHAA